MSFLSLCRKQANEIETTRESYIAELRDLNARICAVRREFDLVSDDSLVEGIIYELLSLSNRQQFLLSALKNLSQGEIFKEKLPSGAK